MTKRRKSNTPDATPVNTIQHGSNGNDGPAGPAPRERIAARAYELYLQRGAGEGRATEDWLEAERELAQGERR